jgi:hypothetical protein
MDLIIKLLNIYDRVVNHLPGQSSVAKEYRGPDITEVMKTFAAEASKM